MFPCTGRRLRGSPPPPPPGPSGGCRPPPPGRRRRCRGRKAPSRPFWRSARCRPVSPRRPSPPSPRSPRGGPSFGGLSTLPPPAMTSRRASVSPMIPAPTMSTSAWSGIMAALPASIVPAARLFPDHLDDELPLSLPVVEIEEHDLLPRPQGEFPVHERED